MHAMGSVAKVPKTVLEDIVTLATFAKIFQIIATSNCASEITAPLPASALARAVTMREHAASKLSQQVQPTNTSAIRSAVSTTLSVSATTAKMGLANLGVSMGPSLTNAMVSSVQWILNASSCSATTDLVKLCATVLPARQHPN